jgi:hypothetical protein
VSVSGLTFGDVTAYSDWITNMNIAGAIGISPITNTFATNLTGFAPQLASSSSVDKSLVSVHFTVSAYDLASNTCTSTAQITVGAEDGDACTAGSYTYVANNMSSPVSFRADSITGTAANGDSLSLSLNPDRITTISESLFGLYGSTDFVQLLVNASDHQVHRFNPLLLAGHNLQPTALGLIGQFPRAGGMVRVPVGDEGVGDLGVFPLGSGEDLVDVDRVDDCSLPGGRVHHQVLIVVVQTGDGDDLHGTNWLE